MATVTVLKALTSYFNDGEGKRSMTQWAAEIKALSADEKLELAQGACKVMGWQLQVDGIMV